MVWCGSKCTGATWERRRKVPPRFGVWAAAGPGSARPVAPSAAAAPPSLRRSRRVTPAITCSSMRELLPKVRRSWGLLVEPGGHQAPAVVVPEVGPVVLQRRRPRRHVDLRGVLHVVLLLGEVALDVVDDLLPLRRVQRAPLLHEHVGDHGIVDVALVLQLAGVVLPVQE